MISAPAALRDRLGTDRWAVLPSAADATGRSVASSLPTDRQAAQTFCAEAGKIVAATPAQLDTLVAATRPVMGTLRQDPTTAALIDAITALKRDDPTPEQVTSCAKAPAADTSLNGKFGFTVTPDQARQAGVTDQSMIDENTGDFVITFTDGSWASTRCTRAAPRRPPRTTAPAATPSPQATCRCSGAMKPAGGPRWT